MPGASRLTPSTVAVPPGSTMAENNGVAAGVVVVRRDGVSGAVEVDDAERPALGERHGGRGVAAQRRTRVDPDRRGRRRVGHDHRVAWAGSAPRFVAAGGPGTTVATATTTAVAATMEARCRRGPRGTSGSWHSGKVRWAKTLVCPTGADYAPVASNADQGGFHGDSSASHQGRRRRDCRRLGRCPGAGRRRTGRRRDSSEDGQGAHERQLDHFIGGGATTAGGVTTLHAGRYHFHVVGRGGDHILQLLRFQNGYTPRQAQQDFNDRLRGERPSRPADRQRRGLPGRRGRRPEAPRRHGGQAERRASSWPST